MRPPSAAPGELRFGIEPGRPPLAYREGHRVVGLEVALARLAGVSLGRPVAFSPAPLRALARQLAGGEVDAIIGDLSRLSSAAPSARLSLPYLRTGQFVAIRTADLAVFQGPDAVADSGAQVGYVRGTPGEDFVRDHLPLSHGYGFEDGAAAIRSLRSHRIDFFVHQEPELVFLAQGAPPGDLLVLPRALSEREFGFAVAPGRRDLLEQLNAFIDRAMADRSLEDVRELWISGPNRTAD